MRLITAFALAVLAYGGVATADQSRPYRVNDQQLRDLATRIATDRDRFQNSLAAAIERSRINGSSAEGQINRAVESFKQATDLLRTRVNDHQAEVADAETVLRRASVIDDLMTRNRLDTPELAEWQAVRRDMDDLARAYAISGNWRDPSSTTASRGDGVQHRLTGTYQLETNRSDDPRRVAEQAARAAPSNQRQATIERLLARLAAPDRLAIERNATRVTMASTQGPRVTFEADGRDRREQWSADQTMSTRATLEGERLTVATTGHRDSDYTATFEPLDQGGLQMTRTIHDTAIRQAVTMRSTYRRVSDQARWNMENRGPRDPYAGTGSSADRFDVPDGTRFVALLDNTLGATSARDGDTFTLTASSPSEYEGAVLEGSVSVVNDPGRRAEMTLTLRRIRFRDGRSSYFEGVIETLRTPDGRTVTVNGEGTVDDTTDGRTQKAVERGAIGAALGAVIGAVVGGTKGAAIGAVIGAGGGAGTVLMKDQDQRDLPRGTEFTITSGRPWEQRLTPSGDAGARQ